MTTALMVIALQQDQAWRYYWRHAKFARVVQTNQRLVRAFGKRQLPMVMITHRRAYPTKRGRTSSVQPLITVSQYDEVMWLVTRQANALQQSQILDFLQQAGVTRVVMTGVVTAAFLTTMSAAKQAGLHPIAIPAACSGRHVNRLATVTTVAAILTQIS